MCPRIKLDLLLGKIKGRVATEPKLSVTYAPSDVNKAKKVLAALTTVTYKPDIICVTEIAREVDEP